MSKYIQKNLGQFWTKIGHCPKTSKKKGWTTYDLLKKPSKWIGQNWTFLDSMEKNNCFFWKEKMEKIRGYMERIRKKTWKLCFLFWFFGIINVSCTETIPE